jgi:uncharacterized protein (TIGR02271 family)
MASLEKDRVLQLRGQHVIDANGDRIGNVEEIYLDAETSEPEWALVNTGMFGTKSTFVPVRDAIEADGALGVPFDKATVKDAPKIDPDGELSQREERELYGYYGMDYSEARSDTGLPDRGPATGTAGRDGVGDDVSGRKTDEAMTRSEEELRVGTTKRETGRARLRKYVVTEQVETTVPVRRENVRLEREPITDANAGAALDGPAISEEEHEVTLHEEEVVVDKRAVPKERVRLDKDTVTEQHEVSEDVRKEQVDLLDADGEPAAGADGVRGTDDGITRR